MVFQRYSSALQTNYLHKGLETGILTLLPLLEGFDLAGDVGDLLEEGKAQGVVPHCLLTEQTHQQQIAKLSFFGSKVCFLFSFKIKTENCVKKNIELLCK